jgi:hypothetical protein
MLVKLEKLKEKTKITNQKKWRLNAKGYESKKINRNSY